MKIRLTCTRCEREALVQQVVDSGGHCPSCGQAYSRDYTAVAARALQAAESAGNELENALERLAAIELTLEIDEESVLGSVRRSLRSINRRR